MQKQQHPKPNSNSSKASNKTEPMKYIEISPRYDHQLTFKNQVKEVKIIEQTKSQSFSPQRILLQNTVRKLLLQQEAPKRSKFYDVVQSTRMKTQS